jgi:hypothetical protein
MNRLTRWCHFPLFFFLVTPFFCVKPRCLGMIKWQNNTQSHYVTTCLAHTPWVQRLLFRIPHGDLGTNCVELGLHLAEYALMKLVPIYMFSMGAGTKTWIVWQGGVTFHCFFFWSHHFFVSNRVVWEWSNDKTIQSLTMLRLAWYTLRGYKGYCSELIEVKVCSHTPCI